MEKKDLSQNHGEKSSNKGGSNNDDFAGRECTTLGLSRRRCWSFGARARVGEEELRSLEICSLFKQTMTITIFENHLNRGRPKPIGNSKHDLLHLHPELVQINCTTPIAVKLLENGIVELGELL